MDKEVLNLHLTINKLKQENVQLKGHILNEQLSLLKMEEKELAEKLRDMPKEGADGIST